MAHAHAHDHDGHSHDHEGHAHGDEGGHGGHHIVSPGLYALVFGGLMVLLILTLGVAMIDLGGNWNLLIAMTVAVLKVILIMTVFMHLRWSSPLVRFFGLVAIFFLVIMFAFTLSDYISRPFVGH